MEAPTESAIASASVTIAGSPHAIVRDMSMWDTITRGTATPDIVTA